MNKQNDIDKYIAGFSDEIQVILKRFRATIKKAAPDAEEIISYQMPAYRQNGMLVYLAVHKNHIGFYPTPTGITAFKNELTTYKSAKGSVQFPLDKPLPLNLITKIVKFKVKENLLRTKKEKKK